MRIQTLQSIAMKLADAMYCQEFASRVFICNEIYKVVSRKNATSQRNISNNLIEYFSIFIETLVEIIQFSLMFIHLC